MGEGGKDRKTEGLEQLPCRLEIRNQRAEGTSGFSKECTEN